MQAVATPAPASGVELDTDPDTSAPPDPAHGVSVAYVYGQQVEYSWHHSIVEMIGYDLANECRLMQGGYIAIHHGTDGLVQARNMAVKTFLEDRPYADWLFWVDTDMGFEPDTVDRLLEVADPVERPVVGGLCFAQRQVGADGMGGWVCQAQPTIYDWGQVGAHAGFVCRGDYKRDTVTRVAGTGSACVLIHRSAFERVQARYGMSWYSRIPNHTMGELTSEDLSFCLRLGSCNIPVHVHTGVKTSHRKSLWLSEREYDAQPAVAVVPPPGLSTSDRPAAEVSGAGAEVAADA